MRAISRAPVFITVLLSGLSLCMAGNLHAADSQTVDSQKAISKLKSMLSDDTHVARWNKFVGDLYKIHQHLVKDRNVYTKESIGGYGGSTDDLEFYREVISYDKATDKLISNIKWENRNPENIHSIDVNIYDDQGRLIRDYSAYYLPKHRNAPYMTLINIHHYNEKLHSIRQYDANNNILFEYCDGTFNGSPVKITHESHQIPDSINEITDPSERDTYKACFKQKTKSAGMYLNPMNEILTL